jgi:hypothetical protein
MPVSIFPASTPQIVATVVVCYIGGAWGVLAMWQSHRKLGCKEWPLPAYGAMWLFFPVTGPVCCLVLVCWFLGWLLSLALPPEK